MDRLNFFLLSLPKWLLPWANFEYPQTVIILQKQPHTWEGWPCFNNFGCLAFIRLFLLQLRRNDESSPKRRDFCLNTQAHQTRRIIYTCSHKLIKPPYLPWHCVWELRPWELARGLATRCKQLELKPEKSLPDLPATCLPQCRGMGRKISKWLRIYISVLSLKVWPRGPKWKSRIKSSSSSGFGVLAWESFTLPTHQTCSCLCSNQYIWIE